MLLGVGVGLFFRSDGVMLLFVPEKVLAPHAQIIIGLALFKF